MSTSAKTFAAEHTFICTVYVLKTDRSSPGVGNFFYAKGHFCQLSGATKKKSKLMTLYLPLNMNSIVMNSVMLSYF